MIAKAGRLPRARPRPRSARSWIERKTAGLIHSFRRDCYVILFLIIFLTRLSRKRSAAGGPKGQQDISRWCSECNERNHRIPSHTRMRPGGGARTPTDTSVLAPLPGRIRVLWGFRGLRSLHSLYPRLISFWPFGPTAPASRVSPP